MKENAKDQTEQAVILLPKSTLDELKEGLCELKELIRQKAQAEAEAQAQWLESEEARKMLGVSQKTWQTYRDNRAIPFSQFGRKIYVKKADIEAFLQSHIIKN